jgi:hypothetical protein
MNGSRGHQLSRIAVVLLCVVVVVPLLAACGGSSGGSPDSDKNDSSGGYPTKVFFGLFHSAGAKKDDVCPLTEALRAGSTRHDPIVEERLLYGWFCLRGFHKDGPPVHLVLTGPLPAKTQVARNLKPIKDPVGYTYWEWVSSRVLRPIGDYRINATQRSRTSGTSLEFKGRLRVVPASEPTIYNAGEEASYPPGASFRIQFSGFPPNSQVMVVLYGPRGARIGRRYEYPFLRALPRAQMDAHGEASYSLASRSDDRPGGYAIWMNPPPAECEHSKLDIACTAFEIES